MYNYLDRFELTVSSSTPLSLIDCEGASQEGFSSCIWKQVDIRTMVSTQVTKVIVLVTLLVGTFTFSMLPVKVVSLAKKQHDRMRRRRFLSVISLLSCYAAGVFLATCLMDLFPQVQTSLNKALVAYNIKTSYPLAEFILGFGLFLILFVEQFVLMVKENTGGRAGYSSLLDSTDSIESNSYQSTNTTQSLNQQPTDGLLTELDDERTEEEQAEAREDPSAHSPTRSLILLLALSLHSIFEGLAVGLQESPKSVLEIFAALALHKCILAFSLGLNLVQSKLSLGSIIKSNLFFSTTSPFGIAVGILVMYFRPDRISANLVDGVLEGVACGTFLFVVFMEILPQEFMSKRKYPNRMLKVLFLILGFSTVAGLLFLVPED